MRTYEDHELTPEMTKTVPEEIPDPMAAMREILATLDPVPDERSKITIEEVERAERVREREAERPIEPPAT